MKKDPRTYVSHRLQIPFEDLEVIRTEKSQKCHCFGPSEYHISWEEVTWALVRSAQGDCYIVEDYYESSAERAAGVYKVRVIPTRCEW